MINLKGKRIVVSEASSGIGKSISKIGSKLGAKILLIGRDEESLEAVTKELYGKDHISLICDITKHEELEDKLKNKLKDFGVIDGFVHSAGIEMTRPLKILKSKNLDDVLQVNLISGLSITRILTGRNIFNKNGGSIVFISSVSGICGQSGKTGYSASKGAVIAASKSLAVELASRKIRVNSVTPAMVKTEMSVNMLNSLPKEAKLNIESMHPLGIGKAEDVANTVAFLLSDLTSWITGTSVIVDGGYSAV